MQKYAKEGTRKEKHDKLKKVRILPHQKIILIVLIFLGIASSILSYIILENRQWNKIRRNFEYTAKKRVAVIEEHLEHDLYSLEWMAALYQASQEVEREEFTKFVQPYLEGHPDIKALEWIPRVLDTERPAYEATAKTDGFANYQITEKDGQGHMVRASRRKEYFPVYLVEPYKGNEAALGFDLASNPERLKALTWSCDNGELSVTEPVTLVQETGSQRSVLVFKPVFHNKTLTDSVENRRKNLQGFVLAVLSMDSFMTRVLANYEPFGMDLYVHDISVPRERSFLGSHKSRTRTGHIKRPDEFITKAELAPTAFNFTDTMEVGNRKWQILCTPAPALLAETITFLPIIVIVSGFGLTCLVFVLALIIFKRAAERSDAEWTFRENDELLNEVTNISKVGGWEMDLITRKAKWTKGVYDIVEIDYGDEIPGPDEHISYYLPEYQPTIKKAMEDLIERGIDLDFEAELKTAKGNIKWCRALGRQAELSNGKCVKIKGTFQDITKHRQIEVNLNWKTAFLEAQIESALDGILVVDQQGQRLSTNQRLLDMWKVPQNVINTKDDAVLLQYVTSKTKNPVQFLDKVKYLYAHPNESSMDEIEFEDGTIFERYSSPVMGGDKQYFGRIWSFRDITERKQAAEKLQHLAMIAEQAGEGIATVDLDGNLQFVNTAWARMHGHETPNELIGKHLSIFHTEEQVKNEVIPFNEHVKHTGFKTSELGHMRKDGTTFSTQMTTTMLRDDKGEPIGLIGFAIDITERKQMEQERENISKFPSENPNPVLRISKDGKVIYTNEAGKLLLAGWKSEVGAKIPDRWNNLIAKAFASERGEEEEEEEVEGKIFSITIAPIKEAGYVNLYASDITERKLAEQKLRYSNDFSQTILDSMQEVITVINVKDYTIEKVNKAFMEMYQINDVEDLKGKTCYQITHAISTPCDSANDPCPLMETLKTGDYASGEHVHYTSDGKKVFVEVSTSPMRDETGKITKVLHITRDVTLHRQIEEEREQMRTQLRQAQKMESIGTLAGGIAHDFNNILAALIGYADLAMDDIPKGTITHQNIEGVLVSANRATELVKQILTFSRKDEAKLVPMQINTIVAEALKMLRSSLPTTIEFRHDINCNSSIMADETQIHQVLINLGTNAAHAMSENGGLLEVNLTDINIDSTVKTRYGNLHHGSYVKLTVKDNGCGMDSEVKERIFEPFFTTKEVGKGTGMGLSVIHGIIENHNGIITVDSKAGVGTTFDIFFPCVENHKIIKKDETEVVFGHGEWILFVDDAKSLVDTATEMLQRMGYEVIGKTNSAEALEVFQEDPDRFDMVITDQTMPKIKGTELAKELMKIRPDIPIILCTGYSESVDSESAKAIGIREFIMKPVNRKEISRIIREVLDKKRVIL